MLGALETGLPGAGRPRRGGGTGWALGAGRDRAAVCALAPLPSRRVRPTRFTATAGPAPGEDGAATAARAGEPGQESSGALSGVGEVVGSAVDLCQGRGYGANQQCG